MYGVSNLLPSQILRYGARTLALGMLTKVFAEHAAGLKLVSSSSQVTWLSSPKARHWTPVWSVPGQKLRLVSVSSVQEYEDCLVLTRLYQYTRVVHEETRHQIDIVVAALLLELLVCGLHLGYLTFDACCLIVVAVAAGLRH